MLLQCILAYELIPGGEHVSLHQDLSLDVFRVRPVRGGCVPLGNLALACGIQCRGVKVWSTVCSAQHQTVRLWPWSARGCAVVSPRTDEARRVDLRKRYRYYRLLLLTVYWWSKRSPGGGGGGGGGGDALLAVYGGGVGVVRNYCGEAANAGGLVHT